MSEPSTTTRRRFLYVLAVASGGGLLAACSQAAQAPSPTAPPAPKPTTAPAPTTPPAAAPTTAPKPTTAAAAAPAAAPTTAPAAVGAAPPPVAKPGQAVPKDHPTIAELYDGAKKEGKVTWWDQHESSVAQKFIDAFQKQFPGVTVEFFEGTQDVLNARSIQEARAGRVSFDFIDTGQNYGGYKDVGIIDAKTDFTDLLTLAGVDKTFVVNGTYSPEFTVYGSAYNTELVKEEELPDSLDGFSNPKWKDKLAIETRLRPYVYGTPFLGGQDAVVDMLKRLKENNPRPTDGDTKSQGLLVAGEFPVLVGAYLQRLIMMKGKPWAFVSFKEVWSSEPGPGYVVPATAPHPNAGRLFLWWFMGPEGQALTDSERFKGNPAPGTGTGPSKYLEEHKMAVRFSPREYEDNYNMYLRKYLEALGLPVT
jgi:iron(III) transport system substrate-binding protein